MSPKSCKGKEYATVSEDDARRMDCPAQLPRDALSEVLRHGAQRLLLEAVEAEVATWIDARRHLTGGDGHRLVVRNGHLPERTILSGVGPVDVKQPRVRDRRPVGKAERFTSAILPPYLRKTKSLEQLIPWLYLKGVSTGDFSEALGALLGSDAPGLSASTVTRLKATWEGDYEAWRMRSLLGKEYVYVWADGIHFNIRLESPGNNRQCILVLIGATRDGTKELLAISDGYRESAQSWRELLLECKSHGLVTAPKLAVGDGGLGFWAALREVYPSTREQRCWVHKTANVLNKMPKSIGGKAKAMLHDIWRAATRAEAERAFDLFLTSFCAKYRKAAECLAKDREVLLTFYDFPAEHWVHLRTTNPIESTFATVRLRTRRTKGCGSRMACLTMVFKLVQCAERHWRALNGSALIPEVLEGVHFVDGVKKRAA